MRGAAGPRTGWPIARRGLLLVLSSPSVPNPTAVRYAYQANPEANLYNKSGLPAVPFATDLPY